MLQSASKWTFISEVLLNKISCHPAWGGLIYSLGALVIEYLSGKIQEVQCHLPTTLVLRNAFALVWMLSPHRGPWGRRTQMREGHDQDIQDTPFMQSLAVTCWSLTDHCTPTQWIPLLTQLEQEWTVPVGRIRLTTLLPVLAYCGSHALLTLLQ